MMAENERDKDEAMEPQGPPGEAAQPTPEAEPEEAAGRALSSALKRSFTFLKWAMTLLVIAYLARGIFVVNEGEVKFKLRFGSLVPSAGEEVLRPGKGWYICWPWERVEVKPTQEKMLELTKEFWTAPPAKGPTEPQKTALNVRQDGYLLTGDTNIVHLKLRARYRMRTDADSAIAYTFFVRDPEAVLRRILMEATTKVVGSMEVMNVITRTRLFDAIKAEVDLRLAAFQEQAGCPLGVDVVAVEAIEGEKNPTEPSSVSRAFSDAQNASSLRYQMEEDAKTEKARIEGIADATKAEILAEARGYSANLVSSASADAKTMEELLPIYNESAAVASILRNNYYHRTVEDVMQVSPGAFILHEAPAGGDRELRLMLSRMPATKRTAGQGQ